MLSEPACAGHDREAQARVAGGHARGKVLLEIKKE